MNFWDEITELEKQIGTKVNTQNALNLREKLQLVVSLLQSSKFSMSIGRKKRAWAFLIIAKKYLKCIR